MSEIMLKQYKVWDAPTRIFHWVNVTTVMLLLVGAFMLYKKVLSKKPEDLSDLNPREMF